MKKRLEIIFSRLDYCDTFADIGCDHGYVSQMMLGGEKCNFAYLTDISAECLKKSQLLLAEFDNKDCRVCDGFGGIEYCEQALIAGMGGVEIIKILENAAFKPPKLLLQPMKDSEKVRRYMLGSGYELTEDFTFADGGKYYDLIKARLGNDSYTELEYAYGRDNLKRPGRDFLEKLKRDSENFEKYSEAGVADKERLTEKSALLKEILRDVRQRFTENS